MPDKSTDHARIIRTAISVYLENKRLEAYDLLDDQKYHAGKHKSEHDAASLLRSCNAMLNLFEGLLSGASDTLSKCIDDFWAAEKLANESVDKEWIGNRVSRGLSYMFGGLLQVFIGSYVKAGVNLTIAFKLIHDFEEDVLSYEGPDQELIRSIGLLVLGLLNFFSIVLPPSITTVSDYLGLGFSREKFHEYIGKCNSENGVFAFVSRLILVYYQVNSKNFMLDSNSKAELEQCRSMMNTCLSEAPNSVIIRVMNASVCLAEGNPDAAVNTLTDQCISQVVGLPEWSTMALATEYKLGVAYLCKMDFGKAASAFGMAAESVEKTNRWHYIPFMKCLQGLSYLASVSLEQEHESIRSTALGIFAQTYMNRDINTAVVMPGDLWGARMGYEYAKLLHGSTGSELESFIKSNSTAVDLMFAMMTCLYQFDKIEISRLTEFMNANLSTMDKTKMKTLVVIGEYYRRIGKYSKAVGFFDDAIALADEEIEKGEKDKDSILGFGLVFQGAALCQDGEVNTAKEVLADLDKAIVDIKQDKKPSIVDGIVKSFMSPETGENSIIPGNLVHENGGEFDLLLSFRRNALKRKIENT
jgi:tetratricopeptide (TPR) repeat protein